MNLEPQKFFIGLVDFFSILMPGAMLAYLGKDWVAVKFGMKQGFPLDGAEAGVVFLFASYLLGHFAFLLSSTLDDFVYDPPVAVPLATAPTPRSTVQAGVGVGLFA